MTDEDSTETAGGQNNMKPPLELGDNQVPGDNQFLDDEQHDKDRIVRHIMVVGFHHKHGYQVDYCYPPLTPGGPMFSTPQRPITLPTCWKTLPLLCLPDGSHNYDSDAIYFTMPDNSMDENVCVEDKGDQQLQQSDGGKNKDGVKTIFGTACYRQIQVDKLLHRTDDMTRLAVQKSVCVLSTKPLFGLIRSKLEMITHAYFEELDFSKVLILKLTYNNLNSLLARESVRENATFLGLSARHLVTVFGNNMLVLFKAMLLEKKILFYKSPVRDLCSTIISMCSLFTGLLECGGLDYATCDLQLSPNLLEALKLEPANIPDECDAEDGPDQRRESRVFFSPTKEEVVILDDSESKEEVCQKMKQELPEDKSQDSGKNLVDETLEKQSQLADTSEFEVIDRTTSNDVIDSVDTSLEETIVEDQHAHKLCQLKPQDCGFPLKIFTRGSFCLPYLAINYLDILSDERVRSFVIGATNFLFKQRREMYDVIVDMEENTITINDPQLKRLLSLSVEDLRFMDYLGKNVKLDQAGSSASPRLDQFDPLNVGDITKWLGGDEWIRYHFRIYTLYLLKAARLHNNMNQPKRNQSSVQGNQQIITNQFVESFNANFVSAWKSNTNNYRIWETTNKGSILDGLQPRHPFCSQAKGLNFKDIRLKFSYAVNSSEKGRLVSQTLHGIGKWSIWNNLASAGNMVGSTLATSAASAHSAIVNTVAQQQQQSHTESDAETGSLVDHEPQYSRVKTEEEIENENDIDNVNR